jgi:predicted nucleic acid-binding protein
MTGTTAAELSNNAAAGKLKIPRFASELDVVDDVMDVNGRINIRGQLESLSPGQRGLFGDGSIGATAIRTGWPVITADKKLAAVLRAMGVEVRVP